MKPRILLVVLILMFAALSCNMPANIAVEPETTPGTGTPGLLTLAVQTAAALQTAQATPGSATPVGQVQPTPTATFIPPDATATRGGVPPTNTPLPCDQAVFVQDVTIPDGTKLAPNQSFTKIWRLRNTGTCTWTTGYAMVFSGGSSMGTAATINLPGNVPPNSTVDLTVDMKAPAAPGKYQGNWRLRNASGGIFGVYGNQPLFVVIEVVASTPTVTVTPTITVTPTVTQTRTVTPTQPQQSGVIYDFAANLCQANWLSQAGVLNCPGTEGDAKGYALRPQNPTLQDGTTVTNPVILTVPDSTKTGAITGQFPTMTIQQGYRFQAGLSCLSGQTQCSVIYQVNFQIGSGTPSNLAQVTHTYTGPIQNLDIDLSSLAGQQVQIILAVLANNSAEGDMALWVSPRIYKP